MPGPVLTERDEQKTPTARLILQPLLSLCGPQLLDTDPATLLRLLLLAPLLEEWIMRAGLQAWLTARYARPVPALLATACVFSLLHVSSGWGAAALVFLPGVALGVLYLRWPDWRVCAVAHALMNAFAVTLCHAAV